MKKSVLLIFAVLFPLQYIHSEKVAANTYFDDGKLHFDSEDKSFRLWFDNRIYIDAADYLPTKNTGNIASDANKDLDDDDGEFKFSNGAVLRRARVAVKSTLYDKWFAELDLDFANNEVETKDMFLGYRINDHGFVKAGQFKEPMSFERLTSSKYLIGMERPMCVEAFGGGRKLGIATTFWHPHYWFCGGFFGEKIDIIQKERNRGSDGHGFTVKGVLSPVSNNTNTLHIGVYARYRTPDGAGDNDRELYLRTYPESRVDRRRFVRTKIKNVHDYWTYGTELGFRHRKFLTYGEYMIMQVSRYTYLNNTKVDLSNAIFSGWYVTTSYMILGGQRAYDPEDAEFGKMAYMHKGGNLEFAARVSNLDLNDDYEKDYEIHGGEATVYSLSLNYFPNRNILLGMNYLFVDQDKYADDNGDLTIDGASLAEKLPDGLDFNILQVRLMVSF